MAKKTQLLLIIMVFLTSLSCAMKPDEAIPSNLSKKPSKIAKNDPIEPFNRAIFNVNMFVDTIAIEPLARGYRFAIPKTARHSVSNALDNLKSPVYLANNLIRLDLKESGVILTRFMINSTLGIAGFFDIAEKFGFPLIKNDFGETLAIWGTNEGFYLVIPFMGPSNFRDATGILVDNALDPLVWIAQNSKEPNAEIYGYIRTGLKALDTREKMLDPIDEIKRSSVDLYAATRTMYRQNRQRQLNKTLQKLGKTAKNEPLGYDFDFPIDE